MKASSLRLRFFSGAALSLALLTSAPAWAKTLATVNGAPITDQDLTVATEDVGPGLPAQLQGQARETYVLDYLVDGKLVAQKAEADKMGDTPEFAKRMAYAREKLLMEDYLGKIAKESATDQAIQAAYDEAKSKQKPEQELHARHILVESEDDAKKIKERLKKGEDFAALATELSKDPGSQGGDLGWFTADRMVPEFSEAAEKLQPGQTSEPVKSQFGWHIILLEGKRDKEFPPLDKVRDQVKRYVIQKAQSEAILKLREAAKIERFDAKPEDAKGAAPDSKDSKDAKDSKGGAAPVKK